jgi:hypothetical protein
VLTEVFVCGLRLVEPIECDFGLLAMSVYFPCFWRCSLIFSCYSNWTRFCCWVIGVSVDDDDFL